MTGLLVRVRRYLLGTASYRAITFAQLGGLWGVRAAFEKHAREIKPRRIYAA